MNLKQLESLERLSNQFLFTLDDNMEDEFWGTERMLAGHTLSNFIDFLKDKLDFESDEVSE